MKHVLLRRVLSELTAKAQISRTAERIPELNHIHILMNHNIFRRICLEKEPDVQNISEIIRSI